MTGGACRGISIKDGPKLSQGTTMLWKQRGVKVDAVLQEWAGQIITS